MKVQRQSFSKLLKALLFYTLLVILWGAWVRISHSGDGCGDHWPFCKGEIIPTAATGKTWVEYTHRAMSGMYGIFVFILVIFARQIFPQGHWARKLAYTTGIFTITEALLGAKLVLFGLVAGNDSPLRAIAMGLHLTNSLCLVGSITLWLEFSRLDHWGFRKISIFQTPLIKSQRVFLGSVIAVLAIVLTGSIASLSTTLFPSESLLAGFQQDLASSSHYLVRWRFLHPLFGILFGSSLAVTAFLSRRLVQAGEESFQNRSQDLFRILLVTIAVGAATLLSLSPVPLKLLHLAATYVTWILMVKWLQSILWTSTRN